MNIGLIVKFRSDGFKMTVNDIDEDGLVECVWHTKQGTSKREKYHIDTLKEVRETPESINNIGSMWNSTNSKSDMA